MCKTYNLGCSCCLNRHIITPDDYAFMVKPGNLNVDPPVRPIWITPVACDSIEWKYDVSLMEESDGFEDAGCNKPCGQEPIGCCRCSDYRKGRR
jgi:hypothetical protein